jgi:hypothetical protein
MKIPVEPDRTIYTYREWARRFLFLDLAEDEARDHWLRFCNIFSGGRN